MMKKSHAANGIAVVIPVYNRATILQDTLRYVMAQTLLPSKLVVVDDGSTDDTAAQAEKWLNDHAGDVDWQLVREPKSTVAHARNFGFSQIGEAEYVAFLDSDDHWPSDFLERCVKSLEAKPDAVAAIAERRYRASSEEPPQSPGGMEMTLNPIAWIFNHGAGIASCTLLRSTVVREIGAWPEIPYNEDTEFFCLISLRGCWVFAEGEPVVFHIGNAAERKEEGNESRKHADREILWIRMNEEIYEKILNEDPSINTRPLKLALALRWHHVCKHHMKRDEWDEARSCSRRALHWYPWKRIYWKRFIKTWLKQKK